MGSSRIIKESHFCSVFTHSQRCNTILRTYSTHQNDKRPGDNPGIVKRFKQMFKDYWYVLLPVHVATSAVWLGGFYISLKSGVDIVGMLESLGTSERILDYLRHSEAGYIALSYACYKIATPARYAVTVGGTTLAISKLKDTGYLKSTSEVASQLRESKTLKKTKDKIKTDLEKRK